MDKNQVIAAALLAVTLFVLVLDGTRAFSDASPGLAAKPTPEAAPLPAGQPLPAADRRQDGRRYAAQRAWA